MTNMNNWFGKTKNSDSLFKNSKLASIDPQGKLQKNHKGREGGMLNIFPKIILALIDNVGSNMPLIWL
jgi:hypothetical protein